jgi:hypothetical protein
VRPTTDRESDANANKAVARVVRERLRAEVVAGEEELLAALVPDGEREVAEQVVDAVLAPGAVRIEEQATVADLARVSSVEAELVDQLRAVVEADVGHDHVAGQPIDERHLFVTDSGVACRAP